MIDRTPASRSLTVVLLVAAATGCSSTANPSDGGGSDVLALGDADAMPTGDASDTPFADVPVARDAGFPCGTLTCDGATQYCQVLRSRDADGGIVDDYRCDPFDIACPSDPTCSCLQRNLKCFNGCSTDNGGVTVVCGT